MLKNSLRGFPLNGCQFKVPSEYRGVVFREDQRPLDENVDRTFKVDGIFDEFTYWNYDKLPSNNDKLKQALDWNTFAQAVSQMMMISIEKKTNNCFSLFECRFQLHEPITAEEYAEELKSQNKT